MSKASTCTTDPLNILNYDCACLVLENLDLQSLGNAEEVNEVWKETIQSWMTGSGLLQHFPDEWKKVTTMQRDNNETAELPRYNRALKVFKNSAIDQLTTEAWKSGHANSLVLRNADVTHRMCPRWVGYLGGLSGAGEFLAWCETGRVLYKHVDSVHPAHELNVGVSSDQVAHMELHAGGYLLVVVLDADRSSNHQHTERLFDLKTGKALWSRDLPPDLCADLTGDGEEVDFKPLAMGWDRIYYFARERAKLLVRDFRTGRLLHTLHIGLFAQGFWAWEKSRVWRLRDRDVLVMFQHAPGSRYTNIGAVHLIDTVSGETLQRIPVDSSEECTLVTSTRRDEVAFALVWELMGYTDRDSFAVRTQTFDYDRGTGKFVERGVQDIDLTHLKGLPVGWFYAGVMQYDPFRGFMVAADMEGQWTRVISLPGAQDQSSSRGQVEPAVSSIVMGRRRAKAATVNVPGLVRSAIIGCGGKRLYFLRQPRGVFHDSVQVNIFEFGPKDEWRLQAGQGDSLHGPSSLA
ncbi:uncharacterized protein DSM5745_00075 [Aspergillus mulundensis]|uniref:F-box domain-containing protein n=1 Tax=Aspergillus mulundensis TaxID=1810919 RepID=A0A3D8T2H6_9EURO|nr:hypothetical protein DSM5745_00075 [Aspergillus mulundensis]RDW92753.1 hypothetical protein DSM5745_00075 [Aspergillus mulundensis]